VVRGLQRRGRNQLWLLFFPAMPSFGLREGRILPHQPIRGIWFRRLNLWLGQGTAKALPARQLENGMSVRPLLAHRPDSHNRPCHQHRLPHLTGISRGDFRWTTSFRRPPRRRWITSSAHHHYLGGDEDPCPRLSKTQKWVPFLALKVQDL